MPKISNILDNNRAIEECTDCPRLINYCKKIAKNKRKSYASENYWGKPVPSFGDHNAEVLIVGLAPAAHGANRTGRMFTGDQSGLWLYRALYKAGFSNQAESLHANDSLKLKNILITAVAHCAPPDNKPTKMEISKCSKYLDFELKNLKNIKAIIVLGKIAFDETLKNLKNNSINPMTKNKPKFTHGNIFRLSNGIQLICSYHPSQQNTFTKKLTEPMFDLVFSLAKNALKQS